MLRAETSACGVHDGGKSTSKWLKTAHARKHKHRFARHTQLIYASHVA